jgi:hypothetical protein
VSKRKAQLHCIQMLLSSTVKSQIGSDVRKVGNVKALGIHLSIHTIITLEELSESTYFRPLVSLDWGQTWL